MTAPQLLNHGLQQGITCVRVELDIHLGGHVVREVVELLSAGHWHEYGGRSLLNSKFDDAYCIVNGLDGAPEAERFNHTAKLACCATRNNNRFLLTRLPIAQIRLHLPQNNMRNIFSALHGKYTRIFPAFSLFFKLSGRVGIANMDGCKPAFEGR